MRKFLEKIKVLQVKSNVGKNKKLGRGLKDARRLNPYNPISYLVIILVLVIGILMFGFVGFWKETDVRNPFKWD